MKTFTQWLKAMLLLSCCLCATAYAEDIDIFGGTVEDDENTIPSVIFVLDNTSNWSRQSQQWPGSEEQGQSEVRAIRAVLEAQVPADGEPPKINVGLMEFTTGGNAATRNGEYVRFALQPLTVDSWGVLSTILDKIYEDITDEEEKKNAPDEYGDILHDVYNYLAGAPQSMTGAGTPDHLADPAGYDTQWSVFDSPLTTEMACVGTNIVFLGNNANGSIASDRIGNTEALKDLYDEVGEAPTNALSGDTITADLQPLEIVQYTTTERLVPEEIVDPVYEQVWVPPVVETPEINVPRLEITADEALSASCYKNDEDSQCPIDENEAGGLCADVPDEVEENLCSCSRLDEDTGCGGAGGGNNRYLVTRSAYTREAYTIPEVLVPGTGVYVDGELLEEGYTIPEYIETTTTATGDPDLTSGKKWNFDDWAKFLYSYGVPGEFEVEGEVVGETELVAARVLTKTYVVDVFNAQQNGELTAVFQSAAGEGGGEYFEANDYDEVVASLFTILGDILADSSSFAAVSLPLTATNRARVDNQVYIGMFRPAPDKIPRWYGNLKRYQLALFNNRPELADVRLRAAINTTNGFLRPCAESFWTTDSGTYWQDLGVKPPPFSDCGEPRYTDDINWSAWSDLPDGPFVEKGGVAQQVRGEGVAATVAASRKVLTESGGDLVDLATTDAAAMGGDAVYNYFRGSDPGLNEVGIPEIMPDSGLRPSIHGDVVHSRPLALRFTPTDVMIYYGSNDGLFRGVNPADGTERWSMVAPEHFGKLSRLYDNQPRVDFAGAQQDELYNYAAKDYFFDGSTGQFVVYGANDEVELAYIYPTMRRGGRMIYALNVTTFGSDPILLWKHGCDEEDNCTSTDFNDIGQTWSTPVSGLVQGYYEEVTVDFVTEQVPKPIVIFGGGFDDCLNEDVAAYPAACNTANGKSVYVLDAASGVKLAKLATEAPVITDVATVDLNFDGYIDYGYAADVAGNLYRINFSTMGSSDPETSLTPLEPGDWTIDKIAATSDNTRRFYNAPVAGAFQGIAVVSLGTGDRERPLEANYPFASNVQNRFYAFFDRPYVPFVDDTPGEGETTTIDLDGDTMYAVVAEPEGEPQELSTLDGWYLDLSDRGEQVANPAAIAGGQVFFNTFQPGGASNGLCQLPKGIATGYALNLFDPEYTTGSVITGGGLPIPPVIATVKIPEGLPPCTGDVCEEVPEDPCTIGDGCKVVTVCIGCDGFNPVEVVPNAPPIRQRVYFSEDIDRQN